MSTYIAQLCRTPPMHYQRNANTKQWMHFRSYGNWSC